MTVKKSLSINDRLNEKLERHQAENPDNKINLSRVFQEALEAEINKRENV